MVSKLSVLFYCVTAAFVIVNCSKIEQLSVFNRIFFGNVAERDKWPWLVALFDTPEDKFFCGGSLISKRHILTAAHCLQNKKVDVAKSPSEVIGYLGKYDLKVCHERGSVPVYPNKFTIHPDWKPFDQKYDADIALIESDDNIPMRQNIYPVGLWTSEMRLVKENDGTIVGWGTSEHQQASEHENNPHEVLIKVVTNEVCYNDEYLAKIISQRTFCAGGENSGPCRGDSGGGLYTPRGPKWYIRGIVSASLFNTDGSCDVEKYAVFTKIESFVGWISSVIKPLVKMNCQYYIQDENYHCKAQNLEVLHDGIKIIDTSGDHVANRVNNDVKKFIIKDQRTTYLPAKISEIFPNLLEYFVRTSGLKHIERINFDGLNHLTSMELGVNKIETIPNDAFYGLPSLELLLLHHNKIEYLDRDLFINSPNLKELFIYANRIEFLDQGLFRKNMKMEGVHIDNNMLTFVEPELLEPLKNLKVGNFQNNNCLSEHFPDTTDKAHLKEIFKTQCKT